MSSETDSPRAERLAKRPIVSFLGRYIVLLVSLVTLFLVYPIMEECKLPSRVWFLNAMFLFVLFSAVATSAKNKRVFWGVVVLAVPTMVIDWVTILSTSRWVYLTNTFFAIAFFTVICAIIMWDVMTSKKVTGDTIAGSICAYLIMGLIWAMVYEFIELMTPGAFSIPGDLVTASGSGHSVGFLSFAYFSFTTMTTLGYGDVTPLSKVAQAFAPMQAVMGQLYVAILVARLVALQVAAARDNVDA